MKQCKYSKIMISRYVDKDLPDQDYCQIEKHINECYHCTSAHSAYINGSRLVRSAFMPGTPEVNYIRVTVKEPAFSIRFLLKPANAAIAVSICALLLVTLSFVLLQQEFSTVSAPVIADNMSEQLNSPLGSILYYSNNDGSTIASQFVTISDGISVDTVSTSVNQLSYSSPLFDDTGYGYSSGY